MRWKCAWSDVFHVCIQHRDGVLFELHQVESYGLAVGGGKGSLHRLFIVEVQLFNHVQLWFADRGAGDRRNLDLSQAWPFLDAGQVRIGEMRFEGRRVFRSLVQHDELDHICSRRIDDGAETKCGWRNIDDARQRCKRMENLNQFFCIMATRMFPPEEQIRVPSTEEELCAGIGSMAADAGLPPPLVLKSLKSDVRSTAHPKRALTNLHRFLSMGFASSWLRDFHEHRLLQRIALEIFSQSQFLADILVRNTELLHWLTSTPVLKSAKGSEEYAREAFEAVNLFQRLEKKLDGLKRFQRRELLRIGARQILKEAAISTTSEELSSLADAIIEIILRLSRRSLSETIGVEPQDSLAIIGLGKLGGRELNFSSDIDLMFVYDEDGPLRAPSARIVTLHEYYTRLSESVVRRLSEHTAEGHLYRVDTRLRPDGHSGPLAMSRSAYVTYYESRGELWERQMLHKARVVAGNASVAKRWLGDIEPFVYPKTQLGSPLEEIARIKSKIESVTESGIDIKLGSGGIRDVEFIVQALQLLNAASIAGLRQQNTLKAIHQLMLANLLRRSEGEELREAYESLRTVEDRLQLLHGLQTHSLPSTHEEKHVLAKQLGFRSVGQFERWLGRHRQNIQRIFRSVFGAEDVEIETERFRGVPGEKGLPLGRLKRIGFLDLTGAAQHLRAVGRELPGLARPERLEPLLALMRQSQAPDWCLFNFTSIASARPIRRTLEHAMSGEKLAELLVLICSRSARFARVLAQEPLLFESLAGRPEELLSPGRGWEFLRSGDAARYRAFNEFKIAVRLLLGDLSIRQFTREVSDLAEEIVVDAFGRALGGSGMNVSPLDVALIGVGKLGGREITIGSDLDLILVYRDPSGTLAKAVQAAARKFTDALSSVYAVDFRLRPEGRSSPLASEFEYYKRYLTDRASFWERQSLVKARLITGDAAFGEEVMEHLSGYTFGLPLPDGWVKELRGMRERMKQERSKGEPEADLKVGSGGLVDIEFLLQALQLRLGGSHEAIRVTNSFRLIDELMGRGLLRKRDGKPLAANLEYLRLLETFIHLNSDTADFILPKDKIRLQALAAAMGERSIGALRETLGRKRKENRTLFSLVAGLRRR